MTVARTVARDSLVKTAIFGSDANWGRIAAAAGYADARRRPGPARHHRQRRPAVPGRGGRGRPHATPTCRARRCSSRSRSGSATARRTSSPRTCRTPTSRRTVPTPPDGTLRRPRLACARRREGGRARRGAALAAALPRPDRRGQVRRQRHDRRASSSRRSPRTWCSCGSPGILPVVVHGGGPQITAMLDRLGLPAEFRGGLRVTTPETIDVVRMVLVGQVGRELVGLINQHGPYAVGLSGEDARPVHRGEAHRARRRRARRHRAGRRRRRGQPGRRARHRLGRPHPGGRGRRPGHRRHRLQHQRRQRRRRAGRRARRGEAGRPHRRRGAVRELPGPRLGHQRAHGGRAGADAARPGVGDGAEDGGLPARGARRRRRRPT